MAAEILRARKDTIRHFRELGATGSESAVTYQPQRHLERRALAYLTGKQVIRLGDEGKYWLDETAAAEWKRAMRNQTVLIGGGLVAAGLALFLAARRRDR